MNRVVHRDAASIILSDGRRHVLHVASASRSFARATEEDDGGQGDQAKRCGFGDDADGEAKDIRRAGR